MKIESSTKPLNAQAIKESRTAGSRQASSPQGEDDVKLSGLAAQLRTSDDSTSFDAARVAEIKQAIVDGRFSINAGAIADRLFASARELVDAKRRA